MLPEIPLTNKPYVFFRAGASFPGAARLFHAAFRINMSSIWHVNRIPFRRECCRAAGFISGYE